jgi:hypothetical protein
MAFARVGEARGLVLGQSSMHVTPSSDRQRIADLYCDLGAP